MNNNATAIAQMIENTPWLSAAVVLGAGWIAALLLRFVLSRFLKLVRFDILCDRVGLSEFLRKGQVRIAPSRLVSVLAFWTILVVAFFWIARILDIKVLSSVSDRVAEFAPGVVAAIFIVIIGLVLVSFVSNFVSTLARTAAYPHTRLLTRVVRVGGWLIIVVLAIEQINLSGTLLSSLVLILVAAAAFGIALAFGLGCKDLAREALVKFLASLREKGRASKGPDLEG
jgi:hypothetical protein